MRRPPGEISQGFHSGEADEPRKRRETPEIVAGGSSESEEPIASLRSVRTQVEIKAILAALERTGWNRKAAARLLKISYRGLLYKIRRHNITAA